MFSQIVFGSALLVVCSLLHVAVVAAGIPMLIKIASRAQTWQNSRRIAAILAAAIGILLVAHTAEIWLWAFSFAILGEFEQFSTSFYFATVTYTTLGYGDVVLNENARIFASFGAITGLFTFGISTAFLIGLLGRVMPNVFESK